MYKKAAYALGLFTNEGAGKTYEETEMKPEGTILSQGKPKGYTIVKGTTLKITVAKAISVDPIEPLLPQE